VVRRLRCAEFDNTRRIRFAAGSSQTQRTPRSCWFGVSYPRIQRIREQLGGWDLALWCPVPDGYTPSARCYVWIGDVDVDNRY